MDPELKEIWSALQKRGPKAEAEEAATVAPEAAASETAFTEVAESMQTPTLEDLRDQAYMLSSIGERREAADMLRRAVGIAEEIEAEPGRMIPIMEALAEVLWQLGEKLEARIFANRAIALWFSSRPEPAFEVTADGRVA